MFGLLSSASVVASVALLTACADNGASPPAEAPAQRLTPAQAHPRASVAPGTLSRIADVGPARSRIAYVNFAALRGFDGPLPAAEIAGLVLGRGASPRSAAATAGTATQIGAATVIDRGGRRVVYGGSAALRRPLATTRPASSLITPETPSAAQSCLGDSVVETILGPAVLGTKAAIGVGLQDDAGQPAGPKLLVCAAPHFRRDLARIERRLRKRFGDDELPSTKRPIIGESDIGERDIVRAVVALDSVDPRVLRQLLAGGPTLRALAGR